MMTKPLFLRLMAATALSWCAVLTGPAKGSAQALQQVPMFCESVASQPEACDTGEPLVAINRQDQISNTSCQGRVAQTPTGIAVFGGCRAVFNLSLAAQRPIYPLLCSSDNYQPRTCVAPQARAAGSRIRAAWVAERQSKKSFCVVGQTFVIDGDTIQVSGGCRANFLYTVE